MTTLPTWIPRSYKREYRIVRCKHDDSYVTVQDRTWWWPFWRNSDLINTHRSVEQAAHFARYHARKKRKQHVLQREYSLSFWVRYRITEDEDGRIRLEKQLRFFPVPIWEWESSHRTVEEALANARLLARNRVVEHVGYL